MSELLAPAGNIEALDAAIGEGADAVYMGLKSFNARLRSSNFAWNQFEAAVQAVHRQKKKIYVTVNTVIEERETERLYRFLSYLDKVGPDGLIVQDFGIIRMCQEFFPNLELHASTQMNIASAKAANLMGKEGFQRVVLARELGLKEIQDIKANSNVELEVFVHGALCVCESGLCLFSSYLGGKSANRGMCAQACRRFYQAEYDGGIEQGYYFSPNDLQLIEKIPDLVNIGVESFKIEGRMKSAYYTAICANTYRMAMDEYLKNPSEYKFNENWLRELNSVSHRDYATGFYFDNPMDNPQTVTNMGYLREKAYLCVAQSDSDADGYAVFMQKNKLSVGDSVELITPGRCGTPFVVEQMLDLKGEKIVSAPHPSMLFKIKVPFGVKAGDILRSSDR